MPAQNARTECLRGMAAMLVAAFLDHGISPAIIAGEMP
jgi:hypothetical protein